MALYFLLLLLLLTWCETAAAIDTAFAHSPQHILTSQSSVPASKSSFGQAVAISENFAVVGDGHEDAVRVHIYKKSQEGPTMGSWSHFQEIDSDLTNPFTLPGTGYRSGGGTPQRGFGSTVQITDNFLLVGASLSERAFIFERKGQISQGFQFELVQQFQPTQLDSVYAQAGHANQHSHCASEAREKKYCDGFGEVLALTDEWVVGVPTSGYASYLGLGYLIGALAYRRNDNGNWPVEVTQIVGDRQTMQGESDLFADKQRDCKSVAISPESTWLVIGCPYVQLTENIKPQVYLYERNSVESYDWLGRRLYWSLKSRFSELDTSCTGCIDQYNTYSAGFGFTISITENWMVVGGSKHWIYRFGNQETDGYGELATPPFSQDNQGLWKLDYAGGNSNSLPPALTDDLWVETTSDITRVYKRTRGMAEGMATWGYACSNNYEGNTETGCPMHFIYRPGATQGATSWNTGINARALSPNGNYLILGDQTEDKAYIYSQNKCTCSNGNPRKGLACLVNGADNCVECSCTNGIAKDSSTCIIDGEHCVSCAAGYGSDTDDSCSASCAAGKYNVGGNSSSCVLCPSGRYSLSVKGTAASSCNLVVEGVIVDSSWSSTHMKVAWTAITADPSVDRYEIEATASADQQSSWESVKGGPQSEVTVDLVDGTQKNSVLVLKAYIENVVGWTSDASMSFRLRFRHGVALGWGSFGPGGISPRGCTGSVLTKALGTACVATCPIGREGVECFSNACPAGKFGAVAPELGACTACAENMFSETEDSPGPCLSCPSGFSQAKVGSAHCCPVTESGLCSECSSKDFCDVSVDCDTNFFDVDGIVANGCEVGCPMVTNATCDACSDENTCTAVTCDVNTFDSDGVTTNGCEARCPEINGGVCDTCSDNNTCTAFTCEEGKTSLQGAICSLYPNELTTCSTTLEAEKATCLIRKTGLQGDVDALTTERDRCAADKTTLLGEKEVIKTERDTLVGEKTTLSNERDQLLAERETLVGEKTTLESESDTLTTEKQTVTAERDSLMANKMQLMTKTNELMMERDELKVERDTLAREKIASEDRNVLLKASLDTSTDKVVALETAAAAISSTSTTPTNTNTNKNSISNDDASSVSHSPSSSAPLSSTNVTKATELEQRNRDLESMVARRGEMVLALSGMLFFCLAVLTIVCFCHLTRKKAPPPSIILTQQMATASKQVGKFGQFMDRHHDAIKRIGHHDHAVSVQKLSRVHSKRKVEKIQKNHFHAKGRLMARLKQRTEASHAAIEAQKVAVASSTLILPGGAVISKMEQQKKMEKRLQKQQRKKEKRKKEKRAKKRVSKVAAAVTGNDGKADPQVVALLRSAMATMMKKSNNYDKMISKFDPQGCGVLSYKKFVVLAEKIGTRMHVMPGLEVFEEAWRSAKTKSECQAGEIEHEILREWIGIGIDEV